MRLVNSVTNRASSGWQVVASQLMRNPVRQHSPMVASGRVITCRPGILLALTVLATDPVQGQRVVEPQAGDSSVTALISSAGVIVEFAGVVRVLFPGDAFEQPESVTVWITDKPTTDQGVMSYDLGDGGSPPYLPKDVTIRATVRPRTVVDIEFRMPDSGLRCNPSPFTPRVFRKFSGGGAMEDLTMYDPLPYTANMEERTLTGHLDPTVGEGTSLYEVLHVGCFRPAA